MDDKASNAISKEVEKLLYYHFIDFKEFNIERNGKMIVNNESGVLSQTINYTVTYQENKFSFSINHSENDITIIVDIYLTLTRPIVSFLNRLERIDYTSLKTVFNFKY